jgi:DNA polymerase elongation subunit (family B)
LKIWKWLFLQTVHFLEQINNQYLSIILNKWFDERVKYKNQMKKAYKAGNAELGASFHLKQYTMKILLNSLYGATALPTFRYAMNEAILSEAITLSGWRIIQESALAANRHINKKIPLGARHRAWNETDELVQFIEVQTGTYFGEDDIIRIEDDYNRT